MSDTPPEPTDGCQESGIDSPPSGFESETHVLIENEIASKIDSEPEDVFGQRVNPITRRNTADIFRMSRENEREWDALLDGKEPNPETADQKPEKPKAEKVKKKSQGGRRSLFDDMELEPGEIDLFEDRKKGHGRKSKGSKRKKISLFDEDLNGDDGEDLFDLKKKTDKGKPVQKTKEMLNELMKDTEPEAVEEKTVPEIEKLDDLRHLFEYKDSRMKFSGPNELRSEIMRRFDRFERLVDSLDFSESGNSDLSAPIPGIVLKESIQRLVSDVHEKDQILKQKELLIEYLQESVDSTFERDQILKQHEQKRAEIEEEKKETDAAQSVCDELQKKVDELESELRVIEEGLRQREKEIRDEHEQEQYKVASLHYEEHEPLEQRIKAAKNELVKHQIELSTLVADNSSKKARIDVEAFESMQQLKNQVPTILTKTVFQMRNGVLKLIENAFNPLREYSGDKIHTAMRNALQTIGKRVLAKS